MNKTDGACVYSLCLPLSFPTRSGLKVLLLKLLYGQDLLSGHGLCWKFLLFAFLQGQVQFYPLGRGGEFIEQLVLLALVVGNWTLCSGSLSEEWPSSQGGWALPLSVCSPGQQWT